MIASAQGITVTQVMEPHKEGLSEIIPLRKHLLRHQGFKAQIGMMEGNTFCTSLLPRLFTIGKLIQIIWGKMILINCYLFNISYLLFKVNNQTIFFR